MPTRELTEAIARRSLAGVSLPGNPLCRWLIIGTLSGLAECRLLGKNEREEVENGCGRRVALDGGGPYRTGDPAERGASASLQYLDARSAHGRLSTRCPLDRVPYNAATGPAKC